MCSSTVREEKKEMEQRRAEKRERECKNAATNCCKPARTCKLAIQANGEDLREYKKQPRGGIKRFLEEDKDPDCGYDRYERIVEEVKRSAVRPNRIQRNIKRVGAAFSLDLISDALSGGKVIKRLPGK